MSSEEWFTVIEQTSPLFGFDVRGKGRVMSEFGTWLIATGLRRPTSMLGDRPLQFMNRDGIGLMVLMDHLSPALVQDETIEFGWKRDELYGEFVGEDRGCTQDGVELEYQLFEKAVNVVVRAPEGKGGAVIKSETVIFRDVHHRARVFGQLVEFMQADELDDALDQIDGISGGTEDGTR